jgi:type IV fimbrial biogenesis protein FimT
MSEDAQRGITLLEILIAIAIVAILAAVAVPSYVDFVNRSRLASAAEAVYSHLQYARSEVVAKNRDVYLRYANASGASADWCIGVSTDDYCDCTDNTPACVLRPSATSSTALPSRTLHGADYPRSFLDVNNGFDKTITAPRANAGAGSPYTATIASADTGQTVSVIVSSNGRVRICSDDLSQYPDC